MSKHYKRNICRRKKHRRKEVRRRSDKDQHHLCYQKKFWRKSPGTQRLRDFHYCKVYIPRDTLHKRIHALVPIVPVPKDINALAALTQLRLLEQAGAISDEDNIERRLMLLAALFDCIEQPTADAFREQSKIVQEFYKKPSV